MLFGIVLGSWFPVKRDTVNKDCIAFYFGI